MEKVDRSSEMQVLKVGDSDLSQIWSSEKDIFRSMRNKWTVIEPNQAVESILKWVLF